MLIDRHGLVTLALMPITLNIVTILRRAQRLLLTQSLALSRLLLLTLLSYWLLGKASFMVWHHVLGSVYTSSITLFLIAVLPKFALWCWFTINACQILLADIAIADYRQRYLGIALGLRFAMRVVFLSLVSLLLYLPATISLFQPESISASRWLWALIMSVMLLGQWWFAGTWLSLPSLALGRSMSSMEGIVAVSAYRGVIWLLAGVLPYCLVLLNGAVSPAANSFWLFGVADSALLFTMTLLQVGVLSAVFSLMYGRAQHLALSA